MGVSVLQRQKILLAPAAAPVAVSRIPISQAWRCQPFHTVAGVPAGLAARCVTSGFACRCLATSVLCSHLSVVPGVSVVSGISRVLCGSVLVVPAQGCFSQGSYPQAGTCVEDLPRHAR